MYQISEELRNAVLVYLNDKPHKEVSVLIHHLISMPKVDEASIEDEVAMAPE